MMKEETSKFSINSNFVVKLPREKYARGFSSYTFGFKLL